MDTTQLHQDKALLLAEIKRLDASMLLIDSPESRDGLEISDAVGSWITTELDVTHTLANWRHLPNFAGSYAAWKNLVDSDWNYQLNRNISIE